MDFIGTAIIRRWNKFTFNVASLPLALKLHEILKAECTCIQAVRVCIWWDLKFFLAFAIEQRSVYSIHLIHNVDFHGA